MEQQTATQVASRLSASERAVSLGISVGVEEGQVVFSGGSFGSHGLFISVSSPERVEAHFDGYCGNTEGERAKSVKAVRQAARVALNVYRRTPTPRNWKRAVEAVRAAQDEARTELFVVENFIYKRTTRNYNNRTYGSPRVFRAVRFNRTKGGWNKAEDRFGA